MRKTFFLLFILITFISSHAQVALHLWGGRDHDIYLGCYNCNKLDKNSIWNQFGKYGSSYNITSIWNSYGSYGSDYSLYSPFSSSAMYPPVIVDRDGNFYGYFTLNEYHAKRSTSQLSNIIYEHHAEISRDVDRWYDAIF